MLISARTALVSEEGLPVPVEAKTACAFESRHQKAYGLTAAVSAICKSIMFAESKGNPVAAQGKQQAEYLLSQHADLSQAAIFCLTFSAAWRAVVKSIALLKAMQGTARTSTRGDAYLSPEARFSEVSKRL